MIWPVKTKPVTCIASPLSKRNSFSISTKRRLMKLNDYLDELAQEAAEMERKFDLKHIIEQAKEKGLITTGAEKVALTVSAKAVLGKRLTGLPPIDKQSGALAAELFGVQTRWMDITPAIAELWLKRNFNNRPLRPDTVRAYAREMKNGKWLPNHQGIAFNNRDELTDGQHRLSAVIMSGCTVRLMVTFGLPSKVKGTRMTGMDTVDRGATRTVADQLKIQHRMEGGAVLSGVCARLAGLCSPERTRRLSVGEVLDIHETFEEAIDWVIERRPKAHGLKQVGVLAAFAFAMTADDACKEHWSRLMSEDPLDADDPLAHLRSFLTGEAAILLTRGSDRALAELVLQVIWMSLKDMKVTALEPGTDGVAYFRDQQSERVEKIARMFELPAFETPIKKGERAAA